MKISEERVADIRRRMTSCQERLRRGEYVEPAEVFAVMYENTMESEPLSTEGRVNRLLLLAEVQRGFDPLGAIALLRAAAALAPSMRGWLRRCEEEIQRGPVTGQTIGSKPVATKKKRTARTSARSRG